MQNTLENCSLHDAITELSKEMLTSIQNDFDAITEFLKSVLNILKWRQTVLSFQVYFGSSVMAQDAVFKLTSVLKPL